MTIWMYIRDMCKHMKLLISIEIYVYIHACMCIGE